MLANDKAVNRWVSQNLSPEAISAIRGEKFNDTAAKRVATELDNEKVKKDAENWVRGVSAT